MHNECLTHIFLRSYNLCSTIFVLHERKNMHSIHHSTSVKVIGANGQISLGKQFAGRQVLVEEQEAGVWLIRTATVIPDNELWLHSPKANSDLLRAIEWSKSHPASDLQTDAILHSYVQANDH